MHVLFSSTSFAAGFDVLQQLLICLGIEEQPLAVAEEVLDFGTAFFVSEHELLGAEHIFKGPEVEGVFLYQTLCRLEAQ